jgi:hypothetical protein
MGVGVAADRELHMAATAAAKTQIRWKVRFWTFGGCIFFKVSFDPSMQDPATMPLLWRHHNSIPLRPCSPGSDGR